MRKAGFRYVFLGIENVLEADLQFLRARAKNLQRGSGANRGTPRRMRSACCTATACTWSAA